MKKKVFFPVLEVVIFLVLNLQAHEKTAIAVLGLDGNGVTDDEKAVFTNRLRSKLFNTGNFIVVERSKMDEILKEQGFENTGCTSNECAVEIGQLLNVKSIVAGNVDKIGTLYTITVRLVDVATGEITKSIDEDCNGCSVEDALLKSISNAADRLAGKEVVSGSFKTDDNNKAQNIQKAYDSKKSSEELSNFTSNVVYLETDPKKIPWFTIDKRTVSLWRFGQPDGDIVHDLTGKGHTLILKNGPVPVDGLRGKAIRFNHNFASAVNFSGLFPGSITVEAIILIENYQHPHIGPIPHSMIVSSQNWDSNNKYGYELRIRENGIPEFSFGTAANLWVTVCASGSLQKKLWYHIAGQFDGDTAKFFVNGRCQGKIPYHGQINPSTSGFGVGRRMVDQPFYFYGQIAEIRISDCPRY